MAHTYGPKCSQNEEVFPVVFPVGAKVEAFTRMSRFPELDSSHQVLDGWYAATVTEVHWMGKHADRYTLAWHAQLIEIDEITIDFGKHTTLPAAEVRAVAPSAVVRPVHDRCGGCCSYCAPIGIFFGGLGVAGIGFLFYYVSQGQISEWEGATRGDCMIQSDSYTQLYSGICRRDKEFAGMKNWAGPICDMRVKASWSQGWLDSDMRCAVGYGWW